MGRGEKGSGEKEQRDENRRNKSAEENKTDRNRRKVEETIKDSKQWTTLNKVRKKATSSIIPNFKDQNTQQLQTRNHDATTNH